MVTNFRAKLELGDFAISTSLFVLLQNWLIEHIMQADREVAWHILNTRLAS
jgi:hemerythrin